MGRLALGGNEKATALPDRVRSREIPRLVRSMMVAGRRMSRELRVGHVALVHLYQGRIRGWSCNFISSPTASAGESTSRSESSVANRSSALHKVKETSCSHANRTFHEFCRRSDGKTSLRNQLLQSPAWCARLVAVRWDFR
jgi:hypothetical protein